MSNGIYKAIADAMADISPIAKGKENKEQRFKYRGVDDIMNELSPILTKHRIFIYPEVIDAKRSERQTKSGSTLLYSILTIKYHFAADDGSEVCTVVIGEGMDSGDKASNKAMAVAFKYACLQVFCIPTEDMDDPDAKTPPPSAPKTEDTEPPPPSAPKGQPDEKQKLGDEIGKVLKSTDPDKLQCFTEQEIEKERAAYINASLEETRNQLNRLKKELAEMLKNFKPLPFGDTPAMFSESEAEFENDIPWADTPKQMDIF